MFKKIALIITILGIIGIPLWLYIDKRNKDFQKLQAQKEKDIKRAKAKKIQGQEIEKLKRTRQ
ncbi:MAG: hypothetical protein ACKO5Q_26895, partial [Microcystaceae cyanobacterium]